MTITISMLLVFLSGIAVGGVGYRLYTVKSVTANAPRPAKNSEEFRKRYLSEVQTRLKLDNAQVQKLGSIMDSTRSLWLAEKDRDKMELKRIHESQMEQVRSILSDTQKAGYEQFHREREQKMKEMDKRR